MDIPENVQKHYSDTRFHERIAEALAEVSAEDGSVDWADLRRLDQFHVRGLSATKNLVEKLAPEASDKVLDVGSGIGGPARFLAATYGCQVTGIDLSHEFVYSATMLTERTGLTDKANFVQGDATAMPFEDARFDKALTQHVAMNILAKDKLYAEVFRVLKRGGMFAIFDVMKGEGGEMFFPVPWAKDESISFVESPEDVEELLRAAGFQEVFVEDQTAVTLAWFDEIREAGQAVKEGPIPNLERNLREGRLATVQMVASKVG